MPKWDGNYLVWHKKRNISKKTGLVAPREIRAGLLTSLHAHPLLYCCASLLTDSGLALSLALVNGRLASGVAQKFTRHSPFPALWERYELNHCHETAPRLAGRKDVGDLGRIAESSRPGHWDQSEPTDPSDWWESPAELCNYTFSWLSAPEWTQ